MAKGWKKAYCVLGMYTGYSGRPRYWKWETAAGTLIQRAGNLKGLRPCKIFEDMDK